MTSPPYPVLYQDARLLAIDKPPGAAVSDRPEDGPDLVARLRTWLGRGARELRTVHRLDRGTSGVLVLALDREAAARMAAGFRAGAARKSYLALVSGDPPSRGRMTQSIRPDPGSARRFLADPALGKPSRTRFRRLGRAAGVALLLLRPETGRTHQLRVHCAAAGYPILGDDRYGGPARVPVFSGPGRLSFVEVPRLALHAVRLIVGHPDDERPIRLRAPLPDDLAGLWRRISGKTGT